MARFYCLTLLILLSPWQHTQADERQLNHRGEYTLAAYVWFVADPHQRLDVQQVIEQNLTLDWQLNEKPEVNLGFSEGTFWFKADISNHNESVNEWLLELAYPLLDHVDFYLLNKQGQVMSSLSTGDQYPAHVRPITHPNFIFPLVLKRDESYTLLIRVENQGSQQIPLRVWQWRDFNLHTLVNYVLQGLFFGMVLIMALYNFMLWVAQRQRLYIVYVGYIVCLSVFLLSMNGLGFLLLWPESSWLNSYMVPLSLAFMIAFLSQFVTDFFDLRKTNPTLGALFRGMVYCYLLIALFSFVLPYHVSVAVLISTAFFALAIAIYTTMKMYHQGHPSARYFVLAWTFFLLGGFMLASNKIGLLPINMLTEHGMQLGASLEVMLLSLALADRMASSQREKLRIQSDRYNLIRRLHHEKAKAYDAEKDKHEMQKQYSANLEAEVVARTEELQDTLKELETANEKLKNISITDALTGLSNRRHFDECLQREYKRAHRDQTSLSIMMLDIDYFKKVNDQYGHAAGDVCLQEVAKCMLSHVGREQDIVARYGGEEFSIILPSTDKEGALQVAEAIRKHVECLHLHWEDQTIRLTISIGLSSQVPQETDFLSRDVMMQRADQALYHAKRSGRNREVHYDDLAQG